MKLKQRLGYGLTLIGGALLLSLVLHVMSFQRVSQLQENDYYKGERVLNSVRSDSQDAASNNVAHLIQALHDLAKHSPDGDAQSPNGAHIPPSSAGEDKEIVRKLLQDKNFNTNENVDNLIKVGKLLEESINRSKANVPSHNDSGVMIIVEKSRDAVMEKSRELEEFDFPKERTTHPVFTLDRVALLTLSKYVNRNAGRHRELKSKAKMPMSFKIHKGASLKNWQRWQNGITQNELYDERKPVLRGFIKDLESGTIVGLSTLPDYGTQIKLVFKFKDGSQALYKPMRWKRDRERDPNLFYFDDFERHQAEIAAFHLDRIMKFNRVPPNVGRFINITSQIEVYASKSLKRTIYVSPGGNTCFYGKCDYYCDSGHPVCGSPDVVEGSMAAWLPFGKGTSKKSWENPWRRSYSKFRYADWETDPDYCDAIKETAPYDTGRRLLDLMDITIFDYLAGNQDRHHYHTFKVFGNQSSPVLYDNGRGFGFMNYDDASILVPVEQCCQIRHSTLVRLVKYESGPDKLSVLMKRSLAMDPVSSGPNGLVLHEGHLKALDRRVSKILDTIWSCIKEHGAGKVILDDGI